MTATNLRVFSLRCTASLALPTTIPCENHSTVFGKPTRDLVPSITPMENSPLKSAVIESP
jgi:hypothetical protein